MDPDDFALDRKLVLLKDEGGDWRATVRRFGLKRGIG